MRLYRRLAYGDLAQFQVLDSRQYRSDHPCGEGPQDRCPAALDPATTMLGSEQERWLLAGLDASTAQWNVLGTSWRSRSRWPGWSRARDRASSIGVTPGRATRRPETASSPTSRAAASPTGWSAPRHPHQLGQRPQGRLARPRLRDDRRRVHLHLDLRGGRRAERVFPPLFAGEPARPLLLPRPRRLRPRRGDPGLVAHRHQGPRVRDPAGRADRHDRLVRRRGRQSGFAACLTVPAPGRAFPTPLSARVRSWERTRALFPLCAALDPQSGWPWPPMSRRIILRRHREEREGAG